MQSAAQTGTMDNALPTEINIITLNCWGLKYISKLRQPRLAEIGRKLAAAQPAPHLVFLQECWTQEDYLAVRRQTRVVLPYGKFYFAGPFGAGLAILSHWPIEETTMVRYPLNGRPTAFWRGDWYVGKGVACAKIRYGPAPRDVLEAFTTHTHAPYDSDKGDSYLVHRIAQSWELSKLLRGAAERAHLVIAAGDFNMTPLSAAHRLITAHAPVRDVWRVMHPDSSLGAADDEAEKARRRPIPTAEFNLAENGATSNNVLNTWRWPRAQQEKLGPGAPEIVIAPDTIDPRGKRLDYIFAGACPVKTASGGIAGWVVESARVGMTARHPELQCSLSDHFSVEATLVFHDPGSEKAKAAEPGPEPEPEPPSSGSEPANGHRQNPPTGGPRQSTLDNDDVVVDADRSEAALRDGAFLQLQTPTPSTDHLVSQAAAYDAQLTTAVALMTGRAGTTTTTATADADRQAEEERYLPPATYDEILSLVAAYVQRECTQRTWRARHFFAWVVVTIACYIAVWFSPRTYVSFILMLLSTLGLVAGTVDGLMALLFFGSELRALKEFDWEMRNAKAAACGGMAPPMQEEVVGSKW